eukprot:9388218-Prorocentrum_lima.AAC.1
MQRHLMRRSCQKVARRFVAGVFYAPADRTRDIVSQKSATSILVAGYPAYKEVQQRLSEVQKAWG